MRKLEVEAHEIMAPQAHGLPALFKFYMLCLPRSCVASSLGLMSGMLPFVASDKQLGLLSVQRITSSASTRCNVSKPWMIVIASPYSDTFFRVDPGLNKGRVTLVGKLVQRPNW